MKRLIATVDRNGQLYPQSSNANEAPEPHFTPVITKGTRSFGKMRNKTHTLCIRCEEKLRELRLSEFQDAIVPVLIQSAAELG
uniref:Uncharacterized protein n=1 Tax=Anopheles epiroticus TaxID=199890 RepID=A0A182P3R9_9DIPT